MKRFEDPVEEVIRGLSQTINDLGEQNREDFRETRGSKTLPYTIGFVVVVIAVFIVFAAVVRP